MVGGGAGADGAPPLRLTQVEVPPEPIQAKLIEGLASLPPARLRAVVAGLEAAVAAMGALEGEATMFFEEEAQGRRRR